MDKRLVGSLRECANRQEVEEMFEKFGVLELVEKTDYLHEAMYKPETFNSTGEVTKDQRYELQMQKFLIGTWKNYPLYQKLGMV